jgi:hypothetical protein
MLVVPVFGARPRLANTRHECFRTDASVPARPGQACAPDEEEQPGLDAEPRSLCAPKQQPARCGEKDVAGPPRP